MDIKLNFNIDLLKTFYIVGKEKNITKASEKLLISQPAVSKAIRALEEQLNLKLFNRSKKGVELTKEGEILLKTSENIINTLNDALNKIEPTNKIKILVGSVLAEKVVAPYINLFQKKYPNIQIELNCTNIEGVLTKLKKNEADLAIGYHIENLEDKYEQSKIFKELHPILVCNGKYKNLINHKVDIKELENYPFIISAKGSTTNKFSLDFIEKNNLNIKPIMEIQGTSLITNLIKKGTGISILTEEFIKEEIENKELYKININKKINTRNLNILTYKERKFSKEILYFINILLEKEL